MAEAPKKYRPARRPYSRLFDIVTESCNPGARAALTEEQAQACCDVLNLAELNPGMKITAGFSKLLEEANYGARARAGYIWRPIETAPKSGFKRKRHYVLVRGPSGMIGIKHFVTVAYHDAEYRPNNPWQTIGNDGLSDYGWVPEEWMEIPE